MAAISCNYVVYMESLSAKGGACRKGEKSNLLANLLSQSVLGKALLVTKGLLGQGILVTQGIPVTQGILVIMYVPGKPQVLGWPHARPGYSIRTDTVYGTSATRCAQPR